MTDTEPTGTPSPFELVYRRLIRGLIEAEAQPTEILKLEHLISTLKDTARELEALS